jgi:hypothetical protein
MSTKHRYWNRSAELKRLIEVLRNIGVSRIETMSIQFVELVKGYANQLQIPPLRKEEIEYVWIKLLD